MGVVDDIKNRIDVVELISNSVVLKKAGRNYKGLCPFHTEKTPSFVVFPDTQSWRCFGACSTGGDIFSFVMKQEGYDFQEALKELAARAGVPLGQRGSGEAAREADKYRQKLLEIVAAAAEYFHHQLLNAPQATSVREYIAGRGLSGETVAKFQLGYAFHRWDALKNHLLERGYDQADLISAGLIIKSEDSPSSYDRFRDRLMIPIHNGQGQVIGFGARALQANQVPKYLNSPQTPLFDKSATVYGLHLARKGIRDSGRAVIVEGYMDVLQAHQAGQTNVVAQMGTALTEPQLKLLKRYTKNFVLALDADTAGDAATLRGIDVARAALDRERVAVPTARGLIRHEERLDADIRIATLPPGKDPDDLLKESVEAWQAVIDGAVPVIDFYFEMVSRDLDLATAKGKSQAVRELVPVLRDIGDPVAREHYLQKLARLVRIDERTLAAELEGRPPPRRAPQPPPPLLPEEERPPDEPEMAAPAMGLEEHCLAMLIGHPAALSGADLCLVEQNVAPLSPDDFQNSENRQIFLAFRQWAAQESPTLETLVGQVGEPVEGRLASLLSLWHNQPPPDPAKLPRTLADAVLRLRIRLLTRHAEELTFLQREAEAAHDQEAVRHYADLAREKTIQLKILNQARDALSIMGQRRLEVSRFG
ncbi:MAG: DNA primase [Anaerolineae bacterium]